jgi:hypothetical protein
MPISRSRPAGNSERTASDFHDDPVLGAWTWPSHESAADVAPDEARRRRIAERAYGRAERRGFAPGRELDDWLAAEAEEDEADRE